jgi:hypothetical protein
MLAGCLTTSFSLHPTQRSLFATQSRFSKILRLLLSIFLIIMALLRSQRVSIGALHQLLPLPHSLCPDSSITHAIDNFFPPPPPGSRSELYLLDEKCYAVGVGIFSPFGTFALLAATFFAALAIDWVRATAAALPCCVFQHLCYVASSVCGGAAPSADTLVRGSCP